MVDDAASVAPVCVGTLTPGQAYLILRFLMENYPELKVDEVIEICVMKTKGDMIPDESLMELEGKGLFTKELDTAFLGKEVNMPVDSMKDVPTWLHLFVQPFQVEYKRFSHLFDAAT